MTALTSGPAPAPDQPALGTTPTSAPPARAAAPDDDPRRHRRAGRLGLLSVSLGTAGLGGAWQSATATVGAPLVVSDALFALSALVWLVLLAGYVRHGGARRSNLLGDLRHPGHGFALSYLPIVGMLGTAHFARFDPAAARWAYALFAATTAVIAARLLAHWLTGGLSAVPLHPGYLLPVSSGPFVAAVTATALHLPGVATAAFAVGLLYWLAFGTVVLGSLVANPALPGPARPTLAVLGIPPTVGGLAWLAAHPGPVDAVGQGFAGLVAFSLLLVAFLLPQLWQRSFHPNVWVYSFPTAATANFTIRWLHGTAAPAWRPLTWTVLGTATLAFAALAAATAAHALRTTRRP
ncbi:TDT family transporter [Kitasatospora cineracea]|uniref:SLAC1 family transporter n=1 Tax=Kitasatospora cineracea TaxID=88074 RepID=UPI0036C99188